MITTVIFDMDGLLLDTENLWGESMFRVAKKHKIDIDMERMRETTGLRIYEVTEHWSRHFPWEGMTAQEVAEEILDDIISLSKESGKVMAGVVALLEMLEANDFKIGLASSSPTRMINALVEHFGIKHHFKAIVSADVVDMGKPHPAVFLRCAEELESLPHECLVLEDSVNGIIAGKAARMKVIAVPDLLHFDDPRLSIADGKVKSLELIDLDFVKSV